MNLIKLVSLLEKAGKEVTSAQDVETNVVSVSFPDEGIVICTDEKDKLIEKAYKWLQHWNDTEELEVNIEDFKKAMEE